MKHKQARDNRLRIRVLSYNIHQGVTIHRRKIAFSMLKAAIKSLDADFVLLQEVAGVDDDTPRARRMETGVSTFQLESLADSIWPYSAYSKNAIFSGGFHGNAILSRYPIKRWNNLDITVPPLATRGLLHGEIEIPDHQHLSVHLMGVHLGLLQYERHKQIRRVCRYVEEKTGTSSICLMGGDFNDWRTVASRPLLKSLNFEEAFMRQNRRHARTFPSRMPVLRLDRIYFRGAELERAIVLRGRPWHSLSDHLPVVADFVVRNPA